MKKDILMVFAFSVSIITNAQVPVESLYQDGKNRFSKVGLADYKEQIDEWQKVIDEDPKNQWAWRNLYMAVCEYEAVSSKVFPYEGTGKSTPVSHKKLVLEKMEKAIPDSYLVYFLRENDQSKMNEENLRKAIERLPADVVPLDLKLLAFHLWKYVGDERGGELKDLLEKAYTKGSIHDEAMRYSWNIFQGMETGAIYFGNDEDIILPGKLIQEVLEVRRDVIIIPTNFLLLENGFRKKLFGKLGIKPFVEKTDYRREYKGNWEKYYLADIVEYIINQTHRPAYFLSDILITATIDQNKLYNEGLLLKYSEKPYDNFSVAMNNVKNLYHLDYLTEPKLTSISKSEISAIEYQYVYLLSNLVKRFDAAGDKAEAVKLKNILINCINTCVASESAREAIKKDNNLT